MRRLISTLAFPILLSGCPGPETPPPPDPPGPQPIEFPDIGAQPVTTHTSVLVGVDELFMSHLPLYGAPHNFQAIFRVTLDQASKDTYNADQIATGEPLYTFFPGQFSFSDLIDELETTGSFDIPNSRIFRGHAERGGTQITNNSTFTVTKALHFRVINPNDADPADGRYLLFGAGDEAFVAHRIAGRPDFDQILSVTAPANAVVDFVAREIQIASQPGDAELVEGQAFTATLLDQEADIQLQTGTEFYLEFGDLSF